MHNRRLLALLIPLITLVSISFFTIAPSNIQAISEVTPTPSPSDDSPAQPEPTTVPPDEEVNVDALLAEGITAVQSNRFDEAIDLLSQVIAIDPTRVNAWLGRALAYSQVERFNEAINDVTEAIALNPWDPTLYSIRASIYEQDGNLGNALLDYDEAIRISPFQADAIVARAEIYAALGDAQSAGIDEALVRGLQNLGFGNPEAALAALDEAIATEAGTPAIALAHYFAAQVFMQTDEPDRVLTAYDNALAIDPSMHIVHLARGIFYRQNGDLAQAGADFTERMRINGRETLEGELTIGTTLEIEMAYQRVHRLTFTADAGTPLTFEASDAPDALTDPLIALLDPNGDPVAGDDDNGGGLNSAIEDFVLPASGTYTLLISHAEGGRSTGFQGTVLVQVSSGVDI